MSPTLPFDPFAIWKSMYEQTESSWNDTIQQTLKKESFSEGLGETLNYYLQFQETVKKMTETYLQQANMPTRGELADVASLIINLEEKVDGIDDKLDEELTKLDATKEIGQLKKAVTNLDRKLDKVLEAIAAIEKEQPTKKAAPVTPTKSTTSVPVNALADKPAPVPAQVEK